MIKLLVGGDGLTHVAEIRSSTGYTNRPITKLYPLEVHSDESANTTARRVSDEVPPAEERLVRQSARKATERMSECMGRDSSWPPGGCRNVGL